jgi:alkyl sulfatase BDS1-like metallo-beta-lactamase superfamily hydrolase
MRWSVLAAVLLLSSACTKLFPGGAPDDGSDASQATRAAAAAYAALPLEDSTDFDDAMRGRLSFESEVVVKDASGRVVWDTNAYAFAKGDAPPTVNPSLWRQARLNDIHGLFEVTPGVYQVRGYDLSNMTIIEGEDGRIVIDPLTARETAYAAYRLVERTLGVRPITAVIFTHSHVDHFGGIAGVITRDEIAERGVRVIAPAGFIEEATSENVIAGIAMRRRADLMYGRRLPRGVRGHVDSGLGKSPAWGTVGLEIPTEQIDTTPTELTIDGVRFVFQYTPESEAPAELTFYLPDKKAFCGAEVVSHTMHNLYTLRGAKVRDALRWSGYIDEALVLFGEEAEVMFASHHWPTWGNARIVDYLEKQRDTYKYIHDQTMRLASSGATPREIAEQLELPESLATTFANRGYYGTVKHNAKAVYQWYFGWYDGNPAHLDPLPPEENGAKYVEAMGGAASVFEKARAAYDAGEYRWAASLLDHLIFADAADGEAEELLARTYEQLGYAAESGPWRDVYLSGAYELRNGKPEGGTGLASAIQLLRHTPMERFFDAFATRLNGPDAEGVDLALNFVFTDIGESYRLWIENSVLHHRRAEPDPDADVTLRITTELMLRVIAGDASTREMIFSDELDIDGSLTDLRRFFSLLDTPDENFAIVRP